MSEPHKPTWMPTWRDESVELSVWAHGYSGPPVGMGGHTRPIAGDTKGLSPCTFYNCLFHLIFSVWDELLSQHSQATWQHVVRQMCVDLALIDACRSRGVWSTQSQSKHLCNLEPLIV